MKERIFISSVQKELAAERRAIRDFVRGDALLGQYFEVFLFEDAPPMARPIGPTWPKWIARRSTSA